MDESEQFEIAAPRADSLIESFRGLGYSLGAALADLVDNSISAGASNIEIDFHFEGATSHVIIQDDGAGMSELELSSAMVLGSMAPSELRAKGDLGRFGLGMKTASFSQARELTVLSRSQKSRATVLRRWDLDEVRDSKEWRLLKTPSSVGESVALEWRAKSGTVVIWTKCDRLVPVGNDAESHFYDSARRAAQHLSMVFHRFLASGKVRLTWNGNSIAAWDPYFARPKHPFTQEKPIETHLFRGRFPIQSRTYILPHRNHLTEAERESGAGINGWNDQQGFYVYRSDRVIIAGGWLGLRANDEHTKLARISIDIPTDVDHEWHIDVTKDSLQLPAEMRQWLIPIAESARREAQTVYRRLGQSRVAPRDRGSLVQVWHDVSTAGAGLKFRINRSHPVISALYEQAGDSQYIDKVLRLIADSMPVNLIALRIASGVDTYPQPFDGDFASLRDLLADLVALANISDSAALGSFLDKLKFSEPFTNFPEVIQIFREEKDVES